MAERGAAASSVSVIVVFHNAEDFLAEALDSALAQSLRPHEVILVDDASTDGSRGIAEQYASHHGTIRILEHSDRANHGPAVSRNLGLRHCSSPLVALLDADDVWMPGKLETEVRMLRKHRQAAMVCGNSLKWFSWASDADEVAALARITGSEKRDLKDRIRTLAGGKYRGLVPPPRLLRRHLRWRDALPQPSAAVLRLEAALEVGGFEESFPFMFEDQAFFSKLAMHYPVFVHGECFTRYRQHSVSLCNRVRTGNHGSIGDKLMSRKGADFFEWLLDYVMRHRPDDRRLTRPIHARLEKL